MDSGDKVEYKVEEGFELLGYLTLCLGEVAISACQASRKELEEVILFKLLLLSFCLFFIGL